MKCMFNRIIVLTVIRSGGWEEDTINCDWICDAIGGDVFGVEIED